MVLSGRTDFAGVIVRVPSPGSYDSCILASPFLRANLDTFDTLLTSDSFRTFTRLIEGTEMETTLRSRTVLTLFAPINQGFSNLPANFLRKLISARSSRILLEVLQYHLVTGRLPAAELAANHCVTTKQGDDLNITDAEDGLRINDARIVLPDIPTRDGLIHGIDELLIPGELALVKYLSLSRSLSVD
jgi:uncharacterized surface protein with fasciclin (FAS1) repeats